MVEDKKKQEDFENGLIDPKTIELDTQFREAIDSGKSVNTVKGSLIVIWDSLNYNFGKIRTRQHMNTSSIQKLMFEQKVTDNKIKTIQVKQSEFRPKVEEHMKSDKERSIKNKAQWGLVSKVLGGAGTVIIMILALLQVFSIIGG